MSKSDLQAKLVQAVMDHDVDLVIQAIRDGAEVDSNVICQAESALQDLEIEYADDTALYAGRTAKNSDRDYIYRIVSRYAKGQKLDTIINSMFNRKTNSLKSKGVIITPKNKNELRKLITLKRQYLGDIDISQIKDLSGLFKDMHKTKTMRLDYYDDYDNVFHYDEVCRTDYGGIDRWDTSHVEYMDEMFYGFDFSEISDDSPLFKWISSLDVSNVKDMGYMFADSKDFNVDISDWDTSNVINMSYMFKNASRFNQDIGSWNTSNVLCMVGMFDGAESFKQNIDNWDTSSINKDYRKSNEKMYNFLDPEKLCRYIKFENCPTVPAWIKTPERENDKYIPKTKMELMMLVRDKNVSLADIDISNINDLSVLFLHCNRNFDGLETWDTSHVENMSHMFAFSRNFNHDISMWNTSKVKYMDGMFQETAFNQNINNWDISNVKDISMMFFCAREFNQPLDKWDTSNVESMYCLFLLAEKFNMDINSWNTSKVKNMSRMFQSMSFNKPLNNWNTSKVTNMESMFYNNNAFNQNISSWNVSKVTNFTGMFGEAASFNQPLNDWDISNATSLKSMFFRNKSFNQPLNNWNTSKVKNMHSLFEEAESFNQYIGDWDVSKVTEMSSMFSGAKHFNQDLSNWKPKSIKRLSWFLEDAKSFRYNLNSWDIEKGSVDTYCMLNGTKIPKPKWYE